jgi:hypothetical protein
MTELPDLGKRHSDIRVRLKFSVTADALRNEMSGKSGLCGIA